MSGQNHHYCTNDNDLLSSSQQIHQNTKGRIELSIGSALFFPFFTILATMYGRAPKRQIPQFSWEQNYGLNLRTVAGTLLVHSLRLINRNFQNFHFF
jgi:hypothetical protein